MEKRTKKELETLKEEWSSYPSWDIEDTDGFEAHRDELMKFRVQMEEKWEKKWEKEYQEKVSKDMAEMAEMGISNRKTYAYFKELEGIVENLHLYLETLEEKLNRGNI